MMSTPADDSLADDDLDTTAKLPILSLADIVDAPPGAEDATGEYRTQPRATAALHAEPDGHWDLSDELVAVRDRIATLETTLADTEIRLTQLQARHDSLQTHHADLLIHSQAVSRDRDRLAEERLLWLANRQQLQDQLEQQHVETSTALLNLQQSLEQERRTSGELHRHLVEHRQHGEALQTELLTAQQQFAEQHTSAAALARTMAQALLEKDDLQRALVAREQRIADLESRFNDTSTRLASAIANRESLLRELSERQAEIGPLQDALNRAVIENGQLGQQLAERDASLNSHQEEIASQARELLVLQEAQAALMQREATLQDSVMQLREELGQVQLQLQERDKLALEQARELDGVHGTNQQLTEQLSHRDQTVAVQAERIANLSASVQRLQDELAAKQLEQGASARQIEALQAELHQHVEAMHAIRRDIQQVALQTRRNEGGTLLRTLTRDDAEGVVHLLNKSSISIGRGPECDIQLRSSSVSRYHAVLRISHDAVILEDMDSTNGCYVNGRRVTRQLLKDGDTLQVGAVPLRFGSRTTQD
jgi:chromosome segregation ATPase